MPKFNFDNAKPQRLTLAQRRRLSGRLASALRKRGMSHEDAQVAASHQLASLAGRWQAGRITWYALSDGIQLDWVSFAYFVEMADADAAREWMDRIEEGESIHADAVRDALRERRDG